MRRERQQEAKAARGRRRAVAALAEGGPRSPRRLQQMCARACTCSETRPSKDPCNRRQPAAREVG